MKLIKMEELKVGDVFTYPPLKIKGREAFHFIRKKNKDNLICYSRSDHKNYKTELSKKIEGHVYWLNNEKLNNEDNQKTLFELKPPKPNKS